MVAETNRTANQALLQMNNSSNVATVALVRVLGKMSPMLASADGEARMLAGGVSPVTVMRDIEGMKYEFIARPRRSPRRPPSTVERLT